MTGSARRGLGPSDARPDANTIWTFRETLTSARATLRLLDLFDRKLRVVAYLVMSGPLVDAPKQRNSKAEKQAIKKGRIPEPGRQSFDRRTRDARPPGSPNGSWTPRPSHPKTAASSSSWRPPPPAARITSAPTGGIA